MLIYIGTQGAGPGQGIHAASFDEATGVLSDGRPAAEVERPTWLVADPTRPILYSVSEVGNAGDRDGAVLGFAIDGDGSLRCIGTTSSGGGGATHLVRDPAGSALFVANFGGGTAALIPLAADGTPGPVAAVRTSVGSGPHRRQQGPHPHGVTLDPSGGFLLVPDMGADRIFVSRYDRGAMALSEAETPSAPLPPGSGPRLLLFGQDGRHAYLLSELSAELYVFAWDARAGRLDPIACVPLDDPGAQGARSAAALTLSADGRHLYASNRTTGAIHAYAIDARSGGLRETQRIDAGGIRPWAAELSPGGRWLLVANQGSDRVSVLGVDPDSGLLSAAGSGLSVPQPTAIAFAAGRPLRPD